MPLPPSPLLIAGWRTTTPFTRIPGWATAHPASTFSLNPLRVRFNGVMCGPRVIADRGSRRKSSIVPRSGRCRPVACTIGGFDAALCRVGRVAEDDGDLRGGRARPRLWRGACVTDPGAISARVLRHAGDVDV